MIADISMARLLEVGNFSEYYCSCGFSYPDERSWYNHLKLKHPAVHMFYKNLKTCYLSLSAFDLSEIADHENRSELLGTFD